MMRAACWRLLAFLLAVAAAHAATITGKVVAIADGDTLTVVTAEKQSMQVRLHGVDAPESKQAFGNRAKQELSSLVFHKTVRVEVADKDRYGRAVGRVFVGDVAVNVEMIRRGFAWWYRDYAKKAVDLAKAEAEARNAKRGLWSEPKPIPPWEFRRNEAEARKVKSGAD